MKQKTRDWIFNHLPDKIYLKRYYEAYMARPLSWRHPKTFTEKIQWLKLYNRDPSYVDLADKYEVKKHIAAVLGEEYVIPAIGVYNSFDEIDLDALPEKFVLKCTHDCNSRQIITDRSKTDIGYLRDFFTRRLKQNYSALWREWVYRKIKPRIIAEPFLSNENEPRLFDYKTYCYHGKAKRIIYVQHFWDEEEEDTEAVFTYYDIISDIQPSRFHQEAAGNSSPPDIAVLKKMVAVAEKLARDMPFVRVDFYYCHGQIYFGEYTFYPNAGFDPKISVEDDLWLGEHLDLSRVKKRR